MGKLLDDLKMYFETTSEEQIEKDMKELDKYNTGPKIILSAVPNTNCPFRKYFKKINENEYKQIKYEFYKKQQQIDFFIPNSIIYNEFIKMLNNESNK